MDYLKKIYNDIVDRIFANPKSSVAGVVAFVAYMAATFGFDVSPEILALISTVLLSIIGLLNKDK